MGLFFRKSRINRRYYDRRQKFLYDLDYFLNGGRERRNGTTDRRLTLDFSEEWRGNGNRIAAITINFQ